MSSDTTQRKAILFLDGGLGTSLEDKYGLCFDQSTPLWSSHLLLQDRDILLACQRDFGHVPVDIISTATYQVSIEGFAKTLTNQFPRGIDLTRIGSFLRDAVDIAETAGQSHQARVALSLGPYGACMVPSQEYSGRYDATHDSVGSLKDWHLERILLFKDAAVFGPRISYIAIETIPRVDEIMALRQALDESRILTTEPVTPFWLSCLYPGELDTLPDGTGISDVITAMLSREVAQSQPWGIGINCTKIWKLPGLVKSYEEAVAALVASGEVEHWPALVIYPDGTNGEVYNTITQTWELPEGSVAPAIAWETQLQQIVLDARDRRLWKQIIVGGCCKTSHSDILRLRNSVEGRLQ